MMDAAWSKFVQMLCFKAASAGCTVVKVEPRGTTQECSQCGTIVPKRLWDRMHSCACGFQADRDYNAALNILKRALGQELPEVTPAEIEPILLSKASSVAEAGRSGLWPRVVHVRYEIAIEFCIVSPAAD